MSQFATVIGYQFKNEEYTSIILDTIEDTRVNGNANITEQPLVSGDVISDHMFNLPKTMTVNGSISMNGSNVTTITGSGSKLANFEEIFERIQKEGIRCDIVKLSTTNDKDIRFTHRHNMALQSFNWTEKVNTLTYNMTFKEILTTQIVAYDVDLDDQYLPNVTEPDTTSFTNTLMDVNEILKQVIEYLTNEDLITNAFKTYLSSQTKETLLGFGITALAVGILTAIIAGPIAAIISVLVVFVGWFISLFVNAFKRKAKIKKFDIGKNEKKNEAELKRFAEFMEDVYTELEQLNTVLHVYRISENAAQEAMISVGDDYFIFTFTKNNTEQVWSMKAENIDQSLIASMQNLTSAPTEFGQLTNSNYLIKANNNATIYIVYAPTNEDNTTTKEADPNDLRNYVILVSDINVEDYTNLVNDILENYIYYS